MKWNFSNRIRDSCNVIGNCINNPNALNLLLNPEPTEFGKGGRCDEIYY